MMKVGALFAGYGGIELALEALMDTQVAWVSDIDKGPSAILAQRFPDAPNLGDVTKIDWSTVEPVDIITGGSPCQDLSHAGKRLGMKQGTRSGLWASMLQGIKTIRPRLVIWENVGGAFSAEATSSMEPCPGCVGDGSDQPILRALGRVLGDLTQAGYDTEWHSLRAADTGAPHGRLRVFVIAWPRDQGKPRLGGRSPLPDTNSDHDPALLSTPQSRDYKGLPGDGFNAKNLVRDIALLRTPCAEETGGGPLHPEVAKARNQTLRLTGQVLAATGHLAKPDGTTADTWGDYAPAISRWEALTRPAPAPTLPTGRGGKHQLSAAFVEWMMGLPQGWVTDTDTTRNEQLKALGNGVVPQQAAEAIKRALEKQ